MSFDLLAPHYDWLEALTAGQRLQRARLAWLDQLGGRMRVLSAGEGHGRFAAGYSRKFPQGRLTCVEGSELMLARAKRRTSHPVTPIEWVYSDILKWMPAEKYDAIVTCFFLDCFPEEILAQVIDKLAHCAEPDAVWLVVDFAVPARGPARWRAQLIHALMYAFFRIFTSLSARRQTIPDDLLRAHGFRLEGRKEYEWGLLRAEVWRRP